METPEVRRGRMERPPYEVNATAWRHQSMARAYDKRPPYPSSLIERLASLALPGCPVLDLGSGTGAVARPMSARRLRVVAVEPSEEMISAGKQLEGGRVPNLEWVCSAAEDFGYPDDYGLAVAAQSIHWMDWDRVFPAIARALAPGAVFALASQTTESQPWAEPLLDLIKRLSTIRDFVACDAPDMVTEKGYFIRLGGQEFPQVFLQPLADYIESFHARSGFARELMGEGPAAEFDELATRLVEPFLDGDVVSIRETYTLLWGRPA